MPDETDLNEVDLDEIDLGVPRRVHIVGVGGAGMSAIAKRTPPARKSGCGFRNSCFRKSLVNVASELARVTIRPPDTEIINAGMTVTRPSPIVRTVYVWSARPSSMPCWNTPIRKPATMLIAVIRMLATESRCVNREAPSIDP